MPSTITSDPAQPDHDPVQPECRAVQPECRAVPTLAPRDVDAATATRLARLGFALMPADAAAAAPPIALVVPRGPATARWRHEGDALLAPAMQTASATASTVAFLVIPAAAPPRPGPVAICTRADAVTAAELYVGAAIAAASDRRVEHLNARGSSGSALHSSIPARATARGAVTDWRERAEPRPERALHALASRPAVIVLTAHDAAGIGVLVADHPDADIVVVVDLVSVRHGDRLTHRLTAVTESALAVQLALAQPPAQAVRAPGVTAPPPRAPRDGLAALKASDVIHARLTGDTLELTNRTGLTVQATVALCDAAAPERIVADVSIALAPGQETTIHDDEIPAIAALPGPHAVLRHWSHEDAEVFEGGRRHIAEVTIAVVAADGTVFARHGYRASNGLSFSLTSREIGVLLGRAANAPALPEPDERPAPASPHAIWTALLSALAVSAAMLPGPEARMP